MQKYDLIDSRKPRSSIEQIQAWLTAHPSAKITFVTQYVANGKLWTSIFYEE